MPPDRLRSIVPMIGGGIRYVETLDAILEFVGAHQPTSDELVGLHRGLFSNRFQRTEDRDTGELTENYALYLSVAERG